MKTIDVKTKEGILRGEDCGSVMVFRGVPYAEAPVGSMRFSAPASKKPWISIRRALEFASICPQADPHGGFYGKEFYDDPAYPIPAMDEDCLYLNVYAPKEGENLPVAVWFHGGAFDHGFSSEMEFDGMDFARNNVILVTVNYRVGVFGFMADPYLRKENPYHTTGNYGMLDQIEALKWVRRNIAAFHGDPSHVGIFGQSAGAMSVQALVASPLTKGLFNRAILQSGAGCGTGMFKSRTLEEAYKTGERIMELAGVETIAELREVKADKLVKILPKLYERTGGMAFGPVVDNYVLDMSSDEKIAAGNIPDIPYMLGMTADDIFVEKGTNGFRSLFFDGMRNFANACAKHKSPVYLYYFDHPLPGDDAGSFHSSELWYVFNTLDRCWRPMDRKDYQLARNMSSAWYNFFKSGNPGWKAYDAESDFVRFWM